MSLDNKALLMVFLVVVMMITTTTAAKPFPAKKYAHNYSHNDFVDTHNAIRAEVGVGPMTWNKTLVDYAQNYANSRLKNNCEFEHSGGPYGENLAEGYGEMTGEQAVKYWADEKSHYDYASNSCVGEECGHYTQLVWRNSIHLGCARTMCPNGWMFVICSYGPPGNYVGERPY
ncbi:basic form of pathogenesis-related protein 1-like [Humulus lupulus]|uniref:basic form of pathogenesis-related protein 1-like n=1 Tax=Humulus lupulus TaxID=3486 RepID=UPI002B40FC0A|nr:basic form of pathogenesis-related protein 1-like [Humulus lupulus]